MRRKKILFYHFKCKISCFQFYQATLQHKLLPPQFFPCIKKPVSGWNFCWKPPHTKTLLWRELFSINAKHTSHVPYKKGTTNRAAERAEPSRRLWWAAPIQLWLRKAQWPPEKGKAAPFIHLRSLAVVMPKQAKCRELRISLLWNAWELGVSPK